MYNLIKQRIKRLRSGSVALLFLVAYSVSIFAPFVSTTTVSAHEQPQNNDSITFCHAKPADTAANGWNELTTSVFAFFQSGHPQHDADIVPPFNYGPGNNLHFPGMNWNATGQAILANGCEKPNVRIDVPPTPKVDDPCGLGNATWIVPKDTDTVTWKLWQNGDLVASTTSGYEFTNGKTWYNYGKAQDSGELCVKFVEATAPTVDKDRCGTNHDTYTIPDVEGVQYFVNGQPVAPGTYSTNGALHVKISAEAKDGYKLIGRDNCWTLDFTNEPCLIPVEAVAPTVNSDPCGTGNDTYTIPYVKGVVYIVNGHIKAPGTYSTHGKAKLEIKAVALPGYKLVGKDCWTLWFTNDACPVEVTPPEQETVCGENNDLIILPETEHVTYTQTGWVDGVNVVTATPDKGYYIDNYDGEGPMQWTFYDEGNCAAEVSVPVDPSVVCGADNDIITVPSNSAHVTYTSTGWVNGKNTITATVDPGYYISGTQGLTTQSWTYTDSNTSCGHVLGASTTTPNVPMLENTGANTSLATYLSMSLLGLAVLTFLQNETRMQKLSSSTRRMIARLRAIFAEPFTCPV